MGVLDKYTHIIPRPDVQFHCLKRYYFIYQPFDTNTQNFLSEVSHNPLLNLYGNIVRPAHVGRSFVDRTGPVHYS